MIPDSNNDLGGVILPIQGRWIDEQQYQPVGQTVLRALSGGLHVYSAGLSGGQPITLLFDLPNSWIYAAKLAELRALADAVGTQYQLTWNTVTYDVLFRHQESPALDFTHVESPGVAIDAGVYVGQIKLMVV